MPKSRSLGHRNRLLGVAMVSVLTVTACGVHAPGANGVRVVTTFTVLADMVRAVAGDRVVVESITKPGTEIHEYEPTPSDLLDAAKADLVMSNGLGLEAWFESFLHRSEAKNVTASRGIRPIPIAGADGTANPHAWMSPRNALRYVENIRAALTELSPEHADTFRSNADDYARRIEAVDRSLRGKLAGIPHQHRALVTCEGAFSYLARDVGLREVYLWPVNSEGQATPQRVGDAVRFVRLHDVPAVFCESTVNAEAQRQVADEAGSRFGGTLYVDSLGGPVPTYLDLLRHDVDTITSGLAGATR